MAGRVPVDRYPWWVKFSLKGVTSRRGQWFFVWLSLATAVVVVVYGLWLSRSVLGTYIAVIGVIGFVISALMYWLVIRWMDKHGEWR